jgi:hypothetical protein
VVRGRGAVIRGCDGLAATTVRVGAADVTDGSAITVVSLGG